MSSVSWKVPEQSQIIYSITSSSKLSGLYFEMCLEFENKNFVQWSVKLADIRACACREEDFSAPCGRAVDLFVLLMSLSCSVRVTGVLQ